MENLLSGHEKKRKISFEGTTSEFVVDIKLLPYTVKVENIFLSKRKIESNSESNYDLYLSKLFYLAVRRVSERLKMFAIELFYSNWYIEYAEDELNWKGCTFNDRFLFDIMDCYSAVERFHDDITNIEKAILPRTRARKEKPSALQRHLVDIPSNFLKHNSTFLSINANKLNFIRPDGRTDTYSLPFFEFLAIKDGVFINNVSSDYSLRPRGLSEFLLEMLVSIEARLKHLFVLASEFLVVDLVKPGTWRASYFLKEFAGKVISLPMYSIESARRKYGFSLIYSENTEINEFKCMAADTKILGWGYYLSYRCDTIGRLPPFIGSSNISLYKLTLHSWFEVTN